MFESINGFDESFFFYFEDMDICKRISDAGWKIRLVNDIQIIHLTAMSSSGVPLGAAVEMMRSRSQYIQKHYGVAAARLVDAAYFANRIRRALVYGACTVLTLGLMRNIRIKAFKNAKICLWFIGGKIGRDSAIYKRFYCDWQAKL